MSTPNSFTVIATRASADELFGLLLTLSYHHRGTNVYVGCDTYTMEKMDKTPFPLNIKWCDVDVFDHFSNETRASMEQKGIFGEFLSLRPKLMCRAIAECGDTLLLGADMIITDPICDVDTSFQLGLSPAFISQANMDAYGNFNADMVWSQSVEVCELWISLIPSSKFFDQKPLDDIAVKYPHFTFGENYNVQSYRMLHSIGGAKSIEDKVAVTDGVVLYCNKPLKMIHAHFSQKDHHTYFKSFFINALKQAGKKYELFVICRIENGEWTPPDTEARIQKILQPHTESSEYLSLLWEAEDAEQNAKTKSDKHFNEQMERAFKSLTISPPRLEIPHLVLRERRLANAGFTLESFELAKTARANFSRFVNQSPLGKECVTTPPNLSYPRHEIYQGKFDDEYAIVAYYTNNNIDGEAAAARALVSSGGTCTRMKNNLKFFEDRLKLSRDVV